MSLRKNVASQVVTFCLVNATTGAALTGATVTTKVTLDGTQGASAGTLTELGSGQYKYVPTAGETNGASVGFLFTATNAVPVNLHVFTTSNDPATVLPTASENATAVWDEGYDGHRLIDTFGQIVGENWYEGGIVASLGTDTINSSSLAASAVSEISNAVVQDVWNTSLSGFPTAGSAGKKLNDLPTANQNADAVWDEARAGHASAGSFGQGVPVSSLANNVVTSASLDASASAEFAARILDGENLDAGLTVRHGLELAAGSVLNRLTGAGTGVEKVRNFSNTEDLASVTIDGNGNKTVVAYNFSI